MDAITSTPTTINDMQKTQLTVLIEKMDKAIAHYSNYDNAKNIAKAIALLKTDAIALLPQEREDMEKVYEQGQSDGFDALRIGRAMTAACTFFTDNYSQYKP